MTKRPMERPPRRRRVFALAGTVALASLALLAPTPADAASDLPPLRERGRVVHVADGDTLDVRDDRSGAVLRIRLTGLNAPELGDCMADVATRRLRDLADGARVTLHATRAGATSYGRAIRVVRVVRPDGRTLDVNEQLLRDGLAVYLPLGGEITDAARYQLAAQEARAAGRGIWDPTACGPGPQAGHPLEMWAVLDADGNDQRNLNGEFVVIANRHPREPLDLAGWRLSDSSLYHYRFASGTRIPAGRTLTVHVGAGRDSDDTRYLGLDSALFDNPDLTTGVGDGAYLHDPVGNLRASFVSPCATECTSSLAGVVIIDDVEADPPGVDTPEREWIRIRNVGSRTVTLDGVQLRVRTHMYPFTPRTTLAPGATLTVVAGRGTDTAAQRFWGKTDPMLRNAGDTVEVVTLDERRIDCLAWGNAGCPDPGPPVPRVANDCTGPLTPLVGDWDGSGRDGIGWWCDGRVRLRTASGAVHDFHYGRPGDVPIVADWNGTGRDTVSVIRDGTWHVNTALRGGPASRTFHYGRVAHGDVPITGSWDGGRRSLPGIIRDGTWHLRLTQSGGPADHRFVYGRLTRGDVPLFGDWNGDRQDGIAVVRDGTWYLRSSLSGGPATQTVHDPAVLPGDGVVAGDWNGDGRSSPGIVKDGRWLLRDRWDPGPASRTIAFTAP